MQINHLDNLLNDAMWAFLAYGRQQGFKDHVAYANEQIASIKRFTIFVPNIGSEQQRLNDYDLASLNLRPHLEAITAYTQIYLTNEPKATKIKRQIKALESIIKN